VNGDLAALQLDRAIGELRRGRAIQLIDGERGLLVAAVETLQPSLLARLVGVGALLMFVTAERASAAGLANQDGGPVALALPADTPLEALRATAGVGAIETAPLRSAVNTAPPSAPLAAAGFQIAKAARLVPALVAVETGIDSTPSVLAIDLRAIDERARTDGHSLQLISRARVPLAESVESEIALFRDEHGLGEHVAVLIGNPAKDSVVPVRLHSACLTGDLLGSLRCDCGEQLRTAVARIAGLGGGVLLYLDQEGRGIGLPNKLRAYVLQDGGLDTVDADQHLGFSSDERTYDVAAALLHELGITRIKLLTNNPQKITALRDHGIEVVGRMPLVTTSNTHNERYLQAKTERAGHLAEEWRR
jgi:GTP cyclohydrolase II